MIGFILEEKQISLREKTGQIKLAVHAATTTAIDLTQVDVMNFRVEYIRSRSGRASHEVARGINKTKDFSESLLQPFRQRL